MECDTQRILKIQEITEKSLHYIRREGITPEQIFYEEPI